MEFARAHCDVEVLIVAVVVWCLMAEVALVLRSKERSCQTPTLESCALRSFVS